MSAIPETRYARSGDVSIAYQVVGEGPLDLAWIPIMTHHVELAWESPAHARFLNRLASISRLIVFDKRGTGMSDRLTGANTLEARMDDIRAVLEPPARNERCCSPSAREAPCACSSPRTYPERTSALVLMNSTPRVVRSPEMPWLPSRAEAERRAEEMGRRWRRQDFHDEIVPRSTRVRARTSDCRSPESSA